MAAIETSQGRIGFIEQGGGEATPIVFLHGVGSDKSVWKPQLDHFAHRRRAVAFDYPGYGESDLVPDATASPPVSRLPRRSKSIHEALTTSCR